MAIAINNLGTSANPDITSGTNADSYSNSSWTPPTTGIIAVLIHTRPATGGLVDPTITGNSLTWVKIAQGDNGSDNVIYLYAALAPPATTGATTIDFGSGLTRTGIHAHFFQITGANVRRTNGISDAFKNFKQASGATGTSTSISLDAAEHADNRPLAAFQHGIQEATAPRTNWTEIDDNSHGAPTSGFESQWRSDTFETTASASWASSSLRVGFACEIVSDTAPTAFTSTITDALGITDAVSRVIDFVKTIADSLGITDLIDVVFTPGSINYTYLVEDGLGLTDVLIKSVGYVKTLADNLGITDSISRVVNKVVTISDTLGLTDVINAVKTAAQNYTVTITDALGLTDSISNYFVYISRGVLRGARDLTNSLLGKRNKTGTLRGKRDSNNDLDGSV